MKRTVKTFCVILSMCLMFTGISLFNTQTKASLASQDPSMTLYTRGTQLVNAQGQAVRLLGTNVPQLGWSIHGENRGVFGVLDIALNEYQSNVVRLAVKPVHWFNEDDGLRENYRGMVDEIIEIVAQEGKYLLLDNHSFFQPGMEDLIFWQDAAARYKDCTNVIFGLFNEPTNSTSWDYWQKGGPGPLVLQTNIGEVIIEEPVGHQQILDAIREVGAKNVVTISGRNWGYDLTNVTTTHRIVDNGGNGIIYETHPYPERTNYDTAVEVAAREYPILVGEFGPKVENLRDASDAVYMDRVFDLFDKYEMHMTAWALGAWPHLYTGPNREPTEYGKRVKAYIAKNLETQSVTLFENTDLLGNNVSLLPGKFTSQDLSEKGFVLSNISSFTSKVNAFQYTLTLYENDDYTGKEFTIMSGTRDLKNLNVEFIPKSIEIDRILPLNILDGNVKSISVPGGEDSKNNLIDGFVSSWEYTAEGKKEIIIEMDDFYLVNNVVIHHAGVAGELSVFNTYDFSVSVSVHGNVFTRVADYKANLFNLTEARFDQILAKYIKIIINRGSFLEPDRAKISEVIAYGMLYEGSVASDPARIPPSSATPTDIPPTQPPSVQQPTQIPDSQTENPVETPIETSSETSEEPTEVPTEVVSEPASSETFQDSVSEQPSDNEPSESGSNTILIIIIIVALILIGGIVFIFIKKSKK